MPTYTVPFQWRHTHAPYRLDLATGRRYPGGIVNATVYENGGWQSVKTTNSNPLWLKKVLSGVDASTAYSRTETSCEYLRRALGISQLISPTYSNVPQIFVSDLQILRGLPDVNVTDATLRDQALKRVKRRINNMTETYQSLIPLAELRELRGLIGSFTQVTTDTVKMIAELKRTKGKSLFSHVSKLWLTYSFGVRPMMADMQDLSNSIWAYLTKGDIKKSKVSGKAKKEWVSMNDWQTTTGIGLMSARYRSSKQHYLSYRFVGAWNFNLRSDSDYSALAHFGVTPPALVPALWETTLLSWVVDYFTTVGDFLEDQFIGHAGQSVYFVENRMYRCIAVGDVDHTIPNSTATDKWSWKYNFPGGHKTTRFEFSRTPLASLPSRILRWKTMDETGLNAVTKLLNLAAVGLTRRKSW